MSQTDTRVDAIRRWLDTAYPDPLSDLRPASEDASFRRYFRADDAASGRSLIIMDAPPDRENITPFIEVTQMLRGADVNAPEIIAQDVEQGFLLLSDLGTRPYLDHLQDDADALYSDAIKALIKMQSIDASTLPAYDGDFLRLEMQLFDDWYADRHLGRPLDDDQLARLESVKNVLIENSLEQPQVFVHRDYHSRNLMCTEEDNPGVIDYQDAMCGALTYDLVSLFKDCYINWRRDEVIAWCHEYMDEAGLEYGLQEFLRWFDLMGVQRHLKVLGIFCRLNYRDGKPQYLDDLPLVKQYLYEVCWKYEELKPLYDLLKELEA